MIIIDRVYCNFCEEEVGQLHHQPAQSPDLLPDHTTAPHFVVCPVCLDAASSELESAA
jgi:hypothetical protein